MLIHIYTSFFSPFFEDLIIVIFGLFFLFTNVVYIFLFLINYLHTVTTYSSPSLPELHHGLFLRLPFTIKALGRC